VSIKEKLTEVKLRTERGVLRVFGYELTEDDIHERIVPGLLRWYLDQYGGNGFRINSLGKELLVRPHDFEEDGSFVPEWREKVGWANTNMSHVEGGARVSKQVYQKSRMILHVQKRMDLYEERLKDFKALEKGET